MSKMPIAWHEECLKARLSSLELDRERLNRLQSSIDRSEDAIRVLSEQIEEAKRQNKDGFDADRFMKRSAK